MKGRFILATLVFSALCWAPRASYANSCADGVMCKIHKALTNPDLVRTTQYISLSFKSTKMVLATSVAIHRDADGAKRSFDASKKFFSKFKVVAFPALKAFTRAAIPFLDKSGKILAKAKDLTNVEKLHKKFLTIDKAWTIITVASTGLGESAKRFCTLNQKLKNMRVVYGKTRCDLSFSNDEVYQELVVPDSELFTFPEKTDCASAKVKLLAQRRSRVQSALKRWKSKSGQLSSFSASFNSAIQKSAKPLPSTKELAGLQSKLAAFHKKLKSLKSKADPFNKAISKLNSVLNKRLCVTYMGYPNNIKVWEKKSWKKLQFCESVAGVFKALNKIPKPARKIIEQATKLLNPVVSQLNRLLPKINLGVAPDIKGYITKKMTPFNSLAGVMKQYSAGKLNTAKAEINAMDRDFQKAAK
ncbi:MAG: hypothetical protein H6727_09120 [Myxococcales bacterium]|nr:hypothetical protein [Myxococcales bacterium]